MITVGSLARHYRLLPSQVIENGTTYDIMIADVMTTWENAKNNPTDLDNYSQEDLLNMVKSVK